MKSSSAALSLLFLLPSIHAAALPQLIGAELESTSSSLKRDTSDNLVPHSPQPGLPEAVASMTDDLSLNPSSNLKRDLSARSPQGPASNPGEFTDVGLSRVNPANHHSSADSPSSSSTPDGQEMDAASKMSHDGHREWDDMVGEDAKTEHHGHHDWNGTHHEHRKDGILAEFNSHGEHIVVYNGTSYPNGTSYSPANETMDGGKMLEAVVVDGDEVVVYRQPWNETRHHHQNHTGGGPMPTATGVWLPSGTGWIPSATGMPRHHHRKVPSAADAGFRGPMSKRGGRSSKYSAGGVKHRK